VVSLRVVPGVVGAAIGAGGGCIAEGSADRAGRHSSKTRLVCSDAGAGAGSRLDSFQFPRLYYKGANTPVEEMVADMNTGLELTSREAVEKTLATDDHTLRQVLRLAGERPGNTVVVFGRGMTTWRKAAYYAPAVSVIVLDHKRIRTSAPAVAIWKGNRQESFSHGPAPLRVYVPAGARIVWLLNPRTEFFALVQQALAPSAADPVYFTDLPQQGGSRVVGEYELAW
jgi:hypothetical protein